MKDSTVDKPYYQAVGVLEGILSLDENGYQMMVNGQIFRVSIVSKRRFQWLREGDGLSLLGTTQKWRVYPRTQPDGSIHSLKLVSLVASDEPCLFTIQGRVNEANGLIKVNIHRNVPISEKTESHPANKSFGLTLAGALGASIGEFWRITSIFNNGFLVAFAGERLQDAPKPVKSATNLAPLPNIKELSEVTTKVKPKVKQK